MSYDIEIVQLTEQPAAVVRGQVLSDKIADFLGPAFGEVMEVVARQGQAPVGPPFARYRTAAEGAWQMEAGFPVTAPVAAAGRVTPVLLPGGEAARTMHTGSYDQLAAAYSALTEWVGEHGYTPASEPWESYLDEPEVPSPRTEVFFPCRPKDAR